jgi:EmrB/QacA subfamily drug resistance transporter
MDARGELTRQQKIFTLVGTLLGLLLAALDQTIVSTAGPAIQRDLRIDASLYAWITTSYLVAGTVMLPIYGKLSDALGRKRVLVAGILVFLSGSALCGLAQTTLQLILFRALQGAGSASLFTSAFAVVADLFPPSERGKYQGLFGAVFGLSSVAGPLAGGFITDHFGWHWVFFINLPVGAVALAFITTRMPALQRPGATLSLDVAGVVALTAFAVPLLLALSLGRGEVRPGETGYPWASPQVASLLGLSVLGLAAFVAAERRAKDPLLDLGLFQDRVFVTGNVASFFVGGTFLSAIVFLPLFMVNVVGLSASSSGLTLTPLSVALVAGNVATGQIVSRTGRYKPLMLGAGVLTCAALLLMGFTLTADSTQPEVTWKMVLVGLGLGPTIPLYTLAIQNAVAPSRVGVATAASSFFRQMGATMGVAVLGTLFGSSLSSGMAARMAEATAGMPPEVVARLRPAGGGGPVGEEAPAGPGLDAAAAKGWIARQFEARRAEHPGDPEVLGALQLQEQAALARVDKAGRALKEAFAAAVANVYRYGLVIALLALLASCAIPSLPLSRGNAQAAPAPLE